MFPDISPSTNGADGAAPTHTLASEAAEQALDTAMLGTYLAPDPPDPMEALPEALPEAPAEPAPEAQPGAAPAAPIFAVGDFAKYDKTIVEILAIHEAADGSELTFDAALVKLTNETGEIVHSKNRLEGKPISSLTSIQSVATKMRLKIGLQLRAAADLESQAADLRAAAEQTKEALTTYQNAKAAIQALMPDLGDVTW